VFRWENPRTYDRVVIVDEQGIRVNASEINGSGTGHIHTFDQYGTKPAPGRRGYGVVGMTNGIGCMETCAVEIGQE
jgi:hypothetical protein